MKPRLRVIESFDPTPEEEAKAERARPVKLPLCIKCKLERCMTISETAQKDLSDAFLLISNVLTSQRAGKLSHSDVEKTKLAHKYVSRAARARYCETCFSGAIGHVSQVVKEVMP